MSEASKLYKVIQPVVFNVRREIGELLELTAEEAEHLAAFIVPDDEAAQNTTDENQENKTSEQNQNTDQNQTQSDQTQTDQTQNQDSQPSNTEGSQTGDQSQQQTAQIPSVLAVSRPQGK